MKLARPDIRHPRIVLAGCPQSVEGDGDDAGLIAALRRRGLHARWMSWDDPATVRADLVILRATRDYPDRLDEFLRWTRRVPNLLNAPDVIAWNLDERYLRDLHRAGVPTLLGRSGGRTRPPGETALVFLGGEQSHAFTTSAVVEPDFELWDVGQAALQAAADHLGIRASDLLYARVDASGKPGDPRLVSLDLVAPSLGWRLLDDAARDDGQRQFAVCVASALERLGLGPFSHRRP
ncbi:MAG TPA: hypothetical protein VEF72_28150 [Mycobacterium sp.]|nr:hypothetical protein [Mycobacterium sp.]